MWQSGARVVSAVVGEQRAPETYFRVLSDTRTKVWTYI